MWHLGLGYIYHSPHISYFACEIIIIIYAEVLISVIHILSLETFNLKYYQRILMPQHTPEQYVALVHKKINKPDQWIYVDNGNITLQVCTMLAKCFDKLNKIDKPRIVINILERFVIYMRSIVCTVISFNLRVGWKRFLWSSFLTVLDSPSTLHVAHWQEQCTSIKKSKVLPARV